MFQLLVFGPKENINRVQILYPKRKSGITIRGKEAMEFYSKYSEMKTSKEKCDFLRLTFGFYSMGFHVFCR